MYSYKEIKVLSDNFLKVETFQDLLIFLEVTDSYFEEITQKPKYNTFYVNKPHGGQRLIEDPTDKLQVLQGKLAKYLQYVYHAVRARSSYAFQWTVDSDVRNTRTNALSHMGKPYMINLDFENYFHQIDNVWLEKIFRKFPFEFKDALLIQKLLTLPGEL